MDGTYETKQKPLSGPETNAEVLRRKKKIQESGDPDAAIPEQKETEKSERKEKARKLLLGSAKSATYNILLQFSMRILSFVLNAIVLHHVSADLLGVVYVRLTLLYSTTLFISTEGFDQACLSKLENKDWKQIINLSWCTVPVSIVICIVFSIIWIFFLEVPDPVQMPYYELGVFSYALATVINCLARPHFVVAKAFLWVGLNVLATAISEFVRIVMAVLLVIKYPSLGIISFSIAHVVCAMTYTAIYYATFFFNLEKERHNVDFKFGSMRDFFPQKPEGKPWFNQEEIVLAKSFFRTAVFKQILTEGEKYIMTIFGLLDFSDQGIYEVINNLGSLVPRFVFKPMEESGYILFSQSLKRGGQLRENSKESIDMTAKVLEMLIRTVCLMGCTILVFGQSYALLFLYFYGGEKISAGSGPLLMKWYSVYILFLALNGVTECYYLATIGNDEIQRYNRKLVLFSLVLLISTLALTKLLGSTGFIIANCINMGTRIAHSVWYIKNYHRESMHRPLDGFRISKNVVISLLISYVITCVSDRYLCCSHGLLYQMFHFAIGAVCFLIVMLTVWLCEQGIWIYILEQYRASRRRRNGSGEGEKYRKKTD